MEFPPSDPSPTNYVPPPTYDFAATAAYDTHSVVPNFNHPSYQEMISSAIIALNEKDGSSRQAIAKYIENEFKIAPSPTHSYELTQQLKRMKNSGQLVLVKHSYMFPGSMPNAHYNSMNQAQVSDVSKKRPGRPPKLQPNGGLMVSSGPPPIVGFENQQEQVGELTTFGVSTTDLFGVEYQFVGGNDVSVLVSNVGGNDVSVPVSNVGGNDVSVPVSNFGGNDVSVPVSNAPTMGYNGGPVYDPGAVANVVPIQQTDSVPAKRGRGRPRKVDNSMVGVERGAVVVSAGPEAASQNNDGDGSNAVTSPMVLGKRRRGRPAKLDMMVPVPVMNGGAKEGQGGQAMVLGEGKRGRGRPRKNAVGTIVAADGAAGAGVLPVAKKPRKVSGKPLGRPKKDASQAASLMSEIQMMAYEGLKARVEHYQSRIKTAVSIVKPYLNETAVIARGALQDLEELANMDIISVPTSVQGAAVDVQSALVNVQSAPVDLNAPVIVQGAAPENIQSAPLTAEAAPVTFQSAPSTGETALSAYQSAPVPVQGQYGPPLQS